MNIQRNLVAAIALAIGFASLPAIAADAVVVEKTTTKHHYVYYGDHQIYFAPETKTYYWQQQGDSTWHSGTMLPAESQAYVKTGGVTMDLDTETPYERDEWVRKHYKDKHENGDKDDGDRR
jgi:hypothetical protein